MKVLRNEKILLTGLTGQIGFPLAVELAKHNEVWGIARFSDPAKQQEIEKLGIKTRTVDLANPDFSQLPDDFACVIHFSAVTRGGFDFDHALRVNAEGTGLLMSHCRKARAFLSMSSCDVYDLPQDPYHAIKETDPLGRGSSVRSPTYSVSKVAQEAVARFVARHLNLLTIIARMNISYGPNGGLPAYQFMRILSGRPVPIQAGRASIGNPIFQDDINSQVAGLLAVASVPANIVNWGGDEAVDVKTYCTYLADLVGLTATFEERSDHLLAAQTVVVDNTKRKKLVGDCRVHWRDGMRQMIVARHPEFKLKH